MSPHVGPHVAPRRISLDIGGSLAHNLPTFSSRPPTQPLISAPANFVLPVAGDLVPKEIDEDHENYADSNHAVFRDHVCCPRQAGRSGDSEHPPGGSGCLEQGGCPSLLAAFRRGWHIHEYSGNVRHRGTRRFLTGTKKYLREDFADLRSVKTSFRSGSSAPRPPLWKHSHGFRSFSMRVRHPTRSPMLRGACALGCCR